MNTRNWLISGALVVICGGVLVLFTDIEVSAVRWWNCGPLAPESERTTEICR